MTDDRELGWRALSAGEVGAVAALAARCLAADGGLPVLADESFLAHRFVGDEVRTLVAVDGSGTLVAAAALRPHTTGVREFRATALVDPAWRGRGLGARLLDWQLAGDGPVTVEAESLTPAAGRLFASRGLTCVFAEDVLRFDVADAPAVRVPDGVVLVPWRDELAPRFFAVYGAAFADRPGFPGWPLEEWVDWVAGDDDFRPQWSLLATTGDGDVGFICCADDWVVQVGVVPAAHRRGRRGVPRCQHQQPGGDAVPPARVHRHRAARPVRLTVAREPPGRGPFRGVGPRRPAGGLLIRCRRWLPERHGAGERALSDPVVRRVWRATGGRPRRRGWRTRHR